MFKIITTNIEKKQNVMFWDEMRKRAEKIRDEYDNSVENKYNNKYKVKRDDSPKKRKRN